MRFFWRGRRDSNYGSSFYRLKLCEIPYENQCVLFIAYNGVQSNAKPLGEKIGENSGAKYRGRNGLRPPVFVITTVRAVSKVQETVPFLPRSSVKAAPARDAVRSRSFLLLSPPACPLRADACDISACPDRTEQPNDSSLIFGASVVKTRKRKKRPIVTLDFECSDNVNGSSGICDRPPAPVN